MPPDTKKSGWKQGLGYAAFGVLAFVFFLYLTFPYEAFKDRLVSEAARLGFKAAIVPRSAPEPPPGIDVLRVATLREAIDRAGLAS